MQRINPVDPRFILPSNAAAPASSGQASSSASAQVTVHPAALTLAHISENAMLALAQVKLQPNVNHQLFGSLAHEGMLYGTLLFQRTEGEAAHFAQRVNISPEDGDATLQVSARRNERGEYDVENIGLHVHNIDVQQSISLVVAPPPVPLPLPAAGSRKKPALVEDPEKPGKMISPQALRQRAYDRELIDDPDNPGQKIARSTHQKRQKVRDPENPGQMISLTAKNSRTYYRKQVPDAQNPGQTISNKTRQNRTLIDDPLNPGEMITRAKNDSRKYRRK